LPPSTLLNPDGVSPELALVDPQLADVARSRLPQEDTLARIELLVRAHRIADARPPAQTEAQTPPPPAAPIAPSPRSTGNRRSAMLGGGVAAVALTSAMLIGVRVDLGGQPAGADSSSIGVPPVGPAVTTSLSSRQPSARPPGKKRAARPHRARGPTTNPRVAGMQPRRFVWAPVEGASGYKVQFFRDSTLVFEARTTKSAVTIPARWTLNGVRHALTPGTYRWNVWPVTGNGQQAKAVVQAQLVVGN
jgi:hypothetical protein